MKGNKNMEGKHFSEKTRMKMSKAHKGKKSYLWQGGKSFEPYSPEFNKRFKKAIRERDNNCCIICNRHETELKKKYNYKIS